MEDFITCMAKYLVEKPEHVQLHVSEEGELTRYTLSVAKSDVGRVVGKEGRIAKAMRTLLVAVAARKGIRVRLDIENVE